MSVFEAIILILGIGLMNVLCFLIGARTGQRVVKGEDVTLPNMNPIEAVRNHQEERRIRKEEENYNINLENIDAYDGTGIGQKDFV